jgi:predicted solute-binding protein
MEALPLTRCLGRQKKIEPVLSEPLPLRDMLRDGRIDAALIQPHAMLALSGPLILLPGGCVATWNHTLTSRVLCYKPCHAVETIQTDQPDSFEAMLCQILWHGEYDRVPSIVRSDAQDGKADAILQVGQAAGQVIEEEYEIEIDPARMWFEQTALPLTVLAWVCCDDTINLDQLNATLAHASRCGLENLHDIIDADAVRLGWPRDLAEIQLHDFQEYRFNEENLDGLEEFFDRAVLAGLAESKPRIEVFYPRP